MQQKNIDRYDGIARSIHWVMAGCISWMFLTALARFFFPDEQASKWLFSTHKSMGMLLLVMITARAVWALCTLRRRPRPISCVAEMGHGALYLLMGLVPLLGWLRQYSSERSFDVFGIPLLAAIEGRGAQWMKNLGDLFHGELGWFLLAAAVGHVLMVIVHRRRGDSDVLTRML